MSFNPGCSGCGVITVAYIRVGPHIACRRCYRDKFGDDKCLPLARRCNYCSGVVHTATAPYVKTRDAYYCDEKCKGDEACRNREQRKREKSSKPPAAIETTPSPGACATGGTSSRENTSARPSQPTTSSKSSPETSKTASFDRDGIGRALRATGVDLPDSDPDAFETEPGRWLIGRTVARLCREDTGPRVVAREGGAWRVQKVNEVRGSFEFDPLSGAPA